MPRSREPEDRARGPWAFRAWGYGLPCLVVGCDTRDRRPGSVRVMEQCHVRAGGMGMKAHWAHSVFMCWRHHDEQHRTGDQTFAARHDLRVVDCFEGIDVGTLREGAAVTHHLFTLREKSLAF